MAGVDAIPFRLGPPDAKTGVLVLHGFTGTPFEVHLLGDALAARGFLVDGPSLAGHCLTTRDLCLSTWRDWVDSAERALAEMSPRVERVGVCGLSMGGLVALELARRHPDRIRAVASLSTALWLPMHAERFIRSFAFMGRFLPKLRGAAFPKIAGSDISDEAMKERNAVAQGDVGTPLISVHSLVEFGEHVRAHLGEVKQPLLLAHSLKDHTIPFACMDAVAREVGSKEVKRVVLERSYHVITLDIEKETVFNAVGDHMQQHL